MEPEPHFLQNLIFTVGLLTVATIPIGGLIRRRARERRQQHEHELQRNLFRYVEAQQRKGVFRK